MLRSSVRKFSQQFHTTCRRNLHLTPSKRIPFTSSPYVGISLTASWLASTTIANCLVIDQLTPEIAACPLCIEHNEPRAPNSWRDKITNLWNQVRKYIRLLLRSLTLGVVYAPALLTAPFIFLTTTASCESILDDDDEEDVRKEHSSWRERWWDLLRSCIRSSGPCSIKFAQWIATRHDLFPPEMVRQLAILQSSSAETMPPWSELEPIFERQYGRDWERVIHLHRDPYGRPKVLGGGCVAQVLAGHTWIPTGRGERVVREIALKVTHPRIKESIQIDLELMSFLVNTLESLVPASKQISLAESVEEFSRLMIDQVDMTKEAESLRRFRRNFDLHARGFLDHLIHFVLRKKSSYGVSFPEPFAGLTNADILVETLHRGLLLRDCIETLSEDERIRVASIGLNAIFKMIFLDNYIHADLHPGNIIYVPDGHEGSQLVLLDTGLVVTLKPIDRHNLIDLFKAVILNDGCQVGRLMIQRSRDAGRVVDPEGFEREMGVIVNRVAQSGLTLEAIGVSELLQRVLLLCYKHQVKLESRFASVIIAMGVVEGLGRQLDPNTDLLARAAPYVMRAAVSKVI